MGLAALISINLGGGRDVVMDFKDNADEVGFPAFKSTSTPELF